MSDVEGRAHGKRRGVETMHSCAAVLTLLTLCAAGSVWAGVAANDVIGIYKKLGSFSAPSSTAAKRCLCVHGDPNASAGRTLLYRDEETYPVDCTAQSDAPDANDCRSTGGSVLSIDE